MNNDIATQTYWKNVWNQYRYISKFDKNYYTNSLLDGLFKKYLPKDKTKEICEIGCALSPYLLYFHDEFEYQINGFDYDKNAVEKTKEIYLKLGYDANIYYHDFFDSPKEQYNILFSMGVFEHFKNLDSCIEHTLDYLKEEGYIVTIIPNMNGIVGFLQKLLNKKVYDIHIPYTKEDILHAHKKSGYKTLFCDYFGVYQGGVINIMDLKYKNIISKLLAVPGKPLFYLNKILAIDSKMNSPYIVYIGKK